MFYKSTVRLIGDRQPDGRRTQPEVQRRYRSEVHRRYKHRMSSGLPQLDKSMEIMDGQQQDSNVSRLSLDQRFSDKDRRSSASGRLRHKSLDRGVDRPSLDQRFGNNDHCPSVSGSHHHKATNKSLDNGTGLQLPMTASASSGQQTVEPPVAAARDCNGHQASPSHGTETTADS